MTAGRELLVRALRALRKSGLWWAFGIGVFGLINVAFWPSFEGSDALSAFEDMSEGLLEAFGAQNIATPAGYLDGQMYALMLPLLLSGMAIAMATSLTSGDEDAGRLELLHALPVSRRLVWLVRFGSVLIVLAVTTVLVAGLMVASLPVFGLEDAGVGAVVLATVACGVLAAFHGAVGFLVGALGGSRGVAVGAAVGILMTGYVMSFVLPIAPSLEDVRSFSAWYWALGSQPVSDGLRPGWLALVVVLTGVLVVAGAAAIERRDIRSA